MGLVRTDIEARYRANKEAAEEPLITPESSKLLRGLLRLTVQRAADDASIKKKQLERFERGGTALSRRDRLWLQSAFETAGADFFMGQGALHVTLNGVSLISYGEVASDLQDLPRGAACAAERRQGGLSQRDAFRATGVPQCRISAIENNRPNKYFLADRVALKRLFDAPSEEQASADRPACREGSPLATQPS